MKAWLALMEIEDYLRISALHFSFFSFHSFLLPTAGSSVGLRRGAKGGEGAEGMASVDERKTAESGDERLHTMSIKYREWNRETRQEVLRKRRVEGRETCGANKAERIRG